MSEREYLMAKALPRALMGLSAKQIEELPLSVAARVRAHQYGRASARRSTHLDGKAQRRVSRMTFTMPQEAGAYARPSLGAGAGRTGSTGRSGGPVAPDATGRAGNTVATTSAGRAESARTTGGGAGVPASDARRRPALGPAALIAGGVAAGGLGGYGASRLIVGRRPRD
jgi:hypothetical protein